MDTIHYMMMWHSNFRRFIDVVFKMDKRGSKKNLEMNSDF